MIQFLPLTNEAVRESFNIIGSGGEKLAGEKVSSRLVIPSTNLKFQISSFFF